MGLGYKRTMSTGDIPVFQGTGKAIQHAQGGFYLNDTGLKTGFIIKAGTPMDYDEAARTAKPLIAGVVIEAAGAAATNYKISKGSAFKVGDNFAAIKGGAAYPITAINTANADYDLVTVGTTIGAVAAGGFVFASSATGAAVAAFSVKGLLYRDTVVGEDQSVSVVIKAIAYARRVPYSADLATALPHIIYSQSF